MLREVVKISESHSRIIMEFQSDEEAGAWSKTFPRPMPSTHRLAYRWENGTNGKPDRLVIEPELIASDRGQGTADRGQQEAPSPSPPPSPGVPGEGERTAEARRTELEAMSEGDVATLYGERGLGDLPKKASKAQIVATILEAEQKKK